MAATQDTTAERRARGFFHLVGRDIGRFDGKLVVVVHVLSSLPPFLDALAEFGDVACLIPKPKSVDPVILRQAEGKVDVLHVKRADLQDAALFDREIGARIGSDRFLTIDIGGYFAPCMAHLSRRFPGQYLGSVEDTENGHQKYQRVALDLPCISVARSRAKRTEDKRVGPAIVFSSDVILRPLGVTFERTEALVIGYGKIGQSIAAALSTKQSRVLVNDIDPCQMTLADSDGFEPVDKAEGLRRASLIYCATGNRAISGSEWGDLRNGAYVISSTSADDELDLSGLAAYTARECTQDITAYSHRGHVVNLLAKGNGVNFVHGAEVRPFVYLVQGTLLAAANQLVRNNDLPAGLSLIDREVEEQVHRRFLTAFQDIVPEEMGESDLAVPPTRLVRRLLGRWKRSSRVPRK